MRVGQVRWVVARGPATLGPPALRLAIAGAGREEAGLRARLAPLGDRSTFLGYVGGETLACLYRASDIVVVPSRYEPFGLVALEAMAAGAPVIASRAGGLAEIVEDGRSGLLVAPGDVRQFAAAIARLAADPDLHRRLGTAGQRRALDGFGWARIAERTTDAYRAVAAHPHVAAHHTARREA